MQTRADSANSIPQARKSPRRTRLGVVVGIAALLIAAFFIVRNSPLKDYFYPKQFRVIVDGKLFVSGQIYSGLFRQTLEDHHITKVVSFTEDPDDADDRAEIAACSAMGIPRVVYPLDGNGTGDIHMYADALADAMQSIDGNGPPLLVHCHSGSERSGAFVAYYRLLIQHRPPGEVLAEMESWHWNPNKNPGLVRYINEHMAELARILVQRGVIRQVPDPVPQLSL